MCEALFAPARPTLPTLSSMADPFDARQARIDTLEAELHQREREIALLRETALVMGGEYDLDTVFHLIALRARDLIQADTVLLPIVSAASEYTYRAAAGANAEEIVGQTLPLDTGLCGWVCRERKPWWGGALTELSDADRNHWEKAADTVIVVPLPGRQRFLGGIAGMNKAGGGEFTRNDLHLLQLFAGQAAIAIENAVAMENVDLARQQAEAAERELKKLNTRLSDANKELEHLSLYDGLTGLPNRSLFRDRLQQEIEANATAGGGFAMLIVDIDRFLEINDTLGHDVGDELLRKVARRCSRALGPRDTVARMSGDEYAVLLSGVDSAAATTGAQRLLARIAAPMQILGHHVIVSAGIGVALYPPHGADISTLFRHADAAMLAAKRDKSGVHLFDELADTREHGRYALIRDLRAALDGGEFSLYYQPKVELCSGSVLGVEALARWHRLDGSLVMPEIFVSALEQTGLIQPFTWWALATVMRQRREWLGRGLDITVAVNVPLSVVMAPDFIAEIGKLVEHYQAQGGIVLELTEHIFLGDYDRLNVVLVELRRYDIECSIDDFGTGHSSLARLRQLPVAELKIDRSFVIEMLANNDDAVIVRSTIDLAHNLGLRVVAEGVENIETLRRLVELRCDSVQGYHITRALPADELESFLALSAWRAGWGGGERPTLQ